MTKQKQLLDLEYLTDWSYEILQNALKTEDVTQAVKAYAAYSGLVTVSVQKNMGKIMADYGSAPSSSGHFLTSILSEITFGTGVAAGFVEILQGSKPNPAYYPKRESAFIGPMTFNPNEMTSLGYTLGYEKSPEINNVFRLIRGPDRNMPS